MSLTHEEIVEEYAAELRQRDADRKLLAEVLRWSRVNGYGKAREYEGGQFSGYSWKAPYQKLFFSPHLDPTLYTEGSAIQPGTIREAIDVLCALGVLPSEKFSSAFAAGRESAYTEDEWRVVAGPDEFPTVFQDEVRTEEHLEIVLRDARNRWRGEVIWVQRRRTGATDWSRVDA